MEHDVAELTFECNKCHAEIVEIEPDLPAFDYSCEVHSDGRGYEALDVVCPECEKEYTVEVTNMFDQYEGVILDEPDISVEIEVPPEIDYEYDYHEYLKSYVPNEPRQRYEHSLLLLDQMLHVAGSLKSYPMFWRMQLLQHVAIMEAYLCDRLITLVDTEQIRIALINNYQNLRVQKISLVAIANKPQLVAETVTMFLKKQLYHEIDTVENLYIAALGASPFIDDVSKTFLKATVINRHHCVHRDGKDNDGQVLEDIDERYLKKVRKHIQDLVDHIETKFKGEISSI